MRSRLLIPVIAAVISLLALVPVSASAHKHSSRNGRCEISLNAPTHLVAGEEVLAFGRLHCVNPANESHQEVSLFHHVWGLPGFTYVQHVTTDAAGFYAISRADGVVDTNRSWYVRARGARSATKRIRVSAQVTLSGPAEGQLLTGFPNRVTFTGTVSPADIGARVILQRQNSLTGNEWHRIDSDTVEPSGTSGVFTIVHRFIVPGDANIRVLVRSEGRNVASESNLLAYSISQAQSRALTIQSSVDPIAFGESATISGKLTSAGEQPVTLLARTVHQRGFAPVAQSTTNAAGEYNFPVQAPANSTFYRVQTAGGPPPCPPREVCPAIFRRRVSSAVLYEGVKDALTAQVSSTTVQAGQTVTFSGTVSPDHTGHIIYLERQNAQAPGFHVIQVWFVGAGSSYAIPHRFYEPGTKLVRVYIPGGPENQGTASAPFSITVTPGSASTLIPEAPANSTLPSEGQS
jgi:hypothetical protein